MADENQEQKNNSRAETEQRLHRFTILVYESAVQIIDVFAMPTDSNIETLFKLSLALFGITGLCQLCGVFTFLGWQGTLLNLLLVAVLMIKEKGEQNVLTKSYKIAASKVKQVSTSRKPPKTKTAKTKPKSTAKPKPKSKAKPKTGVKSKSKTSTGKVKTSNKKRRIK